MSTQKSQVDLMVYVSLFNFEGSITFRWEKRIGGRPLRGIKHGGVAQLGEHLPCKQGVRSSILLISTMGKGTQDCVTNLPDKYGRIAQAVRAHA